MYPTKTINPTKNSAFVKILFDTNVNTVFNISILFLLSYSSGSNSLIALATSSADFAFLINSMFSSSEINSAMD